MSDPLPALAPGEALAPSFDHRLPSPDGASASRNDTLGDLPNTGWPGRRTIALFIIIWALAALIALGGGPALGDHEVIVGQIARQTLQTGDWIVLRYLDTPFLVKPPLAPWIVAVCGWLLPGDAATGLPVTNLAVRLPSVLATLLTVWIVFRLASSMFDRAAGACAAFAYAVSIGTLVYCVNGTAEALLTLFCTWAYAEFWWSQQAIGRERLVHQVRFYIALGLAMLAKAPMPLAVVGVPIAMYWWLERPARLVATGGAAGWRRSMRRPLRDAAVRLRSALRSLGLPWGVPLFALMFVPWMVLVARRVPYFWQLWDYEYLDRLQGEYPGARFGRWFYYLPLLLGMVVPWTLSMPEALAAPFLAVYRGRRRALTYAWFWAVITTLVVSLMNFKKPYYVFPALPGCAVLLGPVLARMFVGRGAAAVVGRARLGVGIAVIAGLAAAVIGTVSVWRLFGGAWTASVTAACLALTTSAMVLIAYAARAFLRGARVRALASVGAISLGVFVGAWRLLGPYVDNDGPPTVLARTMLEHGIDRDAAVYWADGRPDGRVVFYGDRPLRQIVDPYRMLAEERQKGAADLKWMAASRICDLLEGESPVYFVFAREQFDALKAAMRPRAYVWFEVDRMPPGPDEDDWLVVSNRPGPTETLKRQNVETSKRPDAARTPHVETPKRRSS